MIPGQPVLPSLVSQLNPAPDGMTPRGALITGLSSTFGATVTPAIAQPDCRHRRAVAVATGGAFPSTFADDHAAGHARRDRSTCSWSHLAASRWDVGGAGAIEKFTTMAIDVVYGPATPRDTTPPIISSGPR